MAKYVKQYDENHILLSTSKFSNREDLGVKVDDNTFRRVFFSSEKKAKSNGTGIGVTSFKIVGKLKDFNIYE